MRHFFSATVVFALVDLPFALMFLAFIGVIGGAVAWVYALLLPRADAMHLTLVDTRVDGADTFFPEFAAGDWAETHREAHPADSRHASGYAFVDYLRVSEAD